MKKNFIQYKREAVPLSYYVHITLIIIYIVQFIEYHLKTS